MLRYVQVCKCSNVQALKCANVQMCNWGNAEMCKCAFGGSRTATAEPSGGYLATKTTTGESGKSKTGFLGHLQSIFSANFLF